VTCEVYPDEHSARKQGLRLSASSGFVEKRQKHVCASRFQSSLCQNLFARTSSPRLVESRYQRISSYRETNLGLGVAAKVGPLRNRPVQVSFLVAHYGAASRFARGQVTIASQKLPQRCLDYCRKGWLYLLGAHIGLSCRFQIFSESYADPFHESPIDEEISEP
jgi:hypothetical protein